MPVAVAVGFIALASVATEIGVLVLTFIDQELERQKRAAAEANPEVRLTSREITAAVLKGASERVRPVAVTPASTIGGLVPIMWSSATGSEVMHRIAAPMIGGMLTVTLLSLLVLPIIYGTVLRIQAKVRTR